MFNYNPEIRVLINASEVNKFDPQKPTCIILYALPNGNTIEQTAGKIQDKGDDWHYDIQHIAAQTRFMRNYDTTKNYVIVYLETNQLSWPLWKSKYPTTHATVIKGLVEYIKELFIKYNPNIVLTGHSGGGRFIFSFMDASVDIPEYIKRIIFLDSNYGYEDIYGTKIINWLKIREDNYLCVIAYNDSVALYNEKPIVSEKGGTWFKSNTMKNFMLKDFNFTSTIDENFMRFSALNDRVKFILKQNPKKEILHTIQVEKNGLINGMFTGTKLEEKDYKYYGDRVYTKYIQPSTSLPNLLLIPPRLNNALPGLQFMQKIKELKLEEREELIFKEFITGNIPNFLRQLTVITEIFENATGVKHELKYFVMPDYLAIGDDEDFCRIPMTPITAQKIADVYGAILPTRKLVNSIYEHCKIKLEPITYYPVGNNNELVRKFIEHNNAIEQAMEKETGKLGDLLGGTKKDIVLSNLIFDEKRKNNVAIYGWHMLNKKPIQPLTNIHINTYVDYSHGVRLINNQALLDGNLVLLSDLLKDSVKYKIISDEAEPLIYSTYIYQ